MYTGTFCSLTYCDLGYCVFGECILAGSNGFECKCQYGYMGRFCDEKIKPCELNPCKDRGDCVSLGDSDYQCRCYALWTGKYFWLLPSTYLLVNYKLGNKMKIMYLVYNINTTTTIQVYKKQVKKIAT